MNKYVEGLGPLREHQQIRLRTSQHRLCGYHFCSDGLHRQVTAICRDSKLPVRIVYEQGGNLKNRLVRSAERKPSCYVQQRFLEQGNASKRSRGRPKDDCISCLSGLKESECDLTNADYRLTCKVCENNIKLKRRGNYD